MNINKLTITSIDRSNKPLIVKVFPETECASGLIKERLSIDCGNNYGVARVFRKLPKSIPNWVNRKTKVINERKFNTIA